MARILPNPVKRTIYRNDLLAGLVRGSLNRVAPPGLTEVKIAAGSAAGMKMRLDLQLEKDYWLGTYESDLQETIADLIQPGCVAYDIGANIGYVSLLLAQNIGQSGKIFAFEALRKE